MNMNDTVQTEILRKKGIRLNRNEMENLVDEIAAEIKGEANE